MHNHLVPKHSRSGGNDDKQHGTLVPNDVIPMSDGSIPHRSIFTPVEIVQLDRRVTRLEVVTEGISARLDEQKIESRNLRAGMNARFDKVDDRFGKLDAKVDNRFGKLDEKIEKLDTKVSDRFEKLETKFDDRFEKLEAKFDDRFEKLETKFDDRFERFEAKFDAKFDRVDTKFDRVDARFDQVRVHARSDFHLLFGSLIASALGLAGMMAKGFGWF